MIISSIHVSCSLHCVQSVEFSRVQAATTDLKLLTYETKSSNLGRTYPECSQHGKSLQCRYLFAGCGPLSLIFRNHNAILYQKEQLQNTSFKSGEKNEKS
jgi:hypothetical protein